MQTFTEYVEQIRVAIQDHAHRTRFTELVAQCEADLRPSGLLENLFASSILTGLWRLERNPEAAEVDRARIDNSLRRNTAELRRLQTDRHLKEELCLDLPGLISAKDVLKFRKHEKRQERKNEAKPANLSTLQADLHAEIEEEERKQLAEYAARLQNSANLKIRTHSGNQTVPRNAPCPCGSRQKHKRCCGKDAPAQYHFAA